MLRDGLSVYRGEFKPFPSENFYFYSYYGWKEGYFVTRDRELKEAGFNRIWIQEFTDENGHKRFQGTWVK